MLSLRLKLVLWHIAVVALVLAVIGSAIYFYLSRSLLKTIDTSLNQIAKRIEMQLQSGEPINEPYNGPVFAPKFVQIVETDGRILDQIRDEEERQVPVDMSILSQALRQGPQIETASINNDEMVRVITWPIKDKGGEVDYFIRVGQSLRDLQYAQQRILRVLLISVPLALLLSGFGGYFLANKALHPVDRLTKAARNIGAGNLKERVEDPATNDEIGRLAAVFNEMIARLESAFERQRQFTADASHELRTPLAVIRGDIEVALRHERTPEQYRQTLASALEEIVRLSRLVDDLLTLARSDSGEVTIARAPVALDALCQEIYNYTSPLAQAKGLQMSLDRVIDKGSLVVQGDAKRLKQLILNLLDNAIKYTPEGGSVRLRLSKDNSIAILEVIDTGYGISAQDLPHIFERFYRHSHASLGDAGGFGLGLSICQWIVEAHSGQIRVESEPGRGSRFIVELPLMQVISEDLSLT